MKVSIISFLSLIMLSSSVMGQHLWQLPKPPKEKSYLDRLIGDVSSNPKPSRDLNIIWVYGFDEDHIAGAHDYVKVKDLMVGLLSNVPHIQVQEVFGFPNDEQFQKADLVVMYLHLPQLNGKQFKTLNKFVSNGGGLIPLHETAIMRPASKGKKLAESLGLAWNEGTSKWGALFDKVQVDNQHPVFKGFDEGIYIPDEFYWDLFQEDEVKIIGSVRTGPEDDSTGPISEDQLSKNKSPVFWTHQIGEGKVFGTTTGHHTFTFYDPEFRIILFRAMAWTLNESTDIFMPLVFSGITKNGMVGITEDLRGWKGKIRE